VEGRARPRVLRPPLLLTTPCQAPGAPSVRPQPFGDGTAREPGKLSDRAYPPLLELLVALPLERQARQPQRAREGSCAVVGDDQRLPGPRDVRRCERGEPTLG